MLKRTLISLGVLLLLAGVLAQDSPLPPTSFDVRLGIVENRIGRLEADVAGLSVVPTQLARIEEKVTSLADKSDSLGSGISTVVIAVLTMVMGSVTGAAWQARKRDK